MFAIALQKFDRWNLLMTRGELGRMVAAGTIWGLLLTTGLTGMKFWNCETICVDDIAATAALSIAVGTLAIGPVAVYGRHR